MLRLFKTALTGPPQARAAHRQALRYKPSIKTGIEQLQRIYPPINDADDEAPIFLLSAGWRSGSTLLQRLIMSDSRVMIWGEPYDECGVIQKMADSTQAFRDDWPPQDYYYDGSPPDSLSGDWIANLFPSVQDLHKAHRAFFDNLFTIPAANACASRWGIKEVRLGTEHCAYLRWLYPKARFVFLYRNPLEAYRSYCRYGRSWYDIFPDKPVFTPTHFGKHWKYLVEGFVKDASDLDALTICYEDMIAGRTPLSELETYLDISINRDVLSNKVGSSRQGGKTTKVNWLEKRLLKHAVSPIAQQLGYNW